MELSDLTVRPAVALPKDFDGVVFIEHPRPLGIKTVEYMKECLKRCLPNARFVILDDGMRVARLEPEPETS